MSEVEASGRTVHEAIAAGLMQLGVDEDQVDVEVLDEVGERPPGGPPMAARVRLTVRAGGGEQQPSGPVAVEQDRDHGEVLEAAREEALDFLEGLLDVLEVDGDVDAEVDEETGAGIRASIVGDDLGLLIGRHGQVLEATQELLRAAVQRRMMERIRISLDVGGYRERRREAIQKHTHEMVRRAREDGAVTLEAMPAFERKIVHETVAAMEGVRTFSQGEEPRRRVVIETHDE